MYWDTMAPNGTARIRSILADTVSANVMCQDMWSARRSSVVGLTLFCAPSSLSSVRPDITQNFQVLGHATLALVAGSDVCRQNTYTRARRTAQRHDLQTQIDHQVSLRSLTAVDILRAFRYT